VIWTSFISFIFNIESKQFLNILKQKEINDINLQYNTIAISLDNLINDIRIISKENELKDFLKKPNQENKLKLANEFENFVNNRKDYDQIRFLNNKGKEIIRINLINNKAVIVNDNDLQSKQHRYYFRKIINLDKDEIFISKLDLNIENHKIEFPFKPMLRIGTPIFDENNQKRGVLIINFLAQRIIDLIAKNNFNDIHRIFLLNQNKYFLLSDNKDEEWAFMFPDKKHLNVDKKFPNLWENIKNKKSGQIMLNEGLFTFKKIDFNVLSFLNEKNLNKKNIKSEFSWIIISYINSSNIDNTINLFKKRFKYLKFIYIIAFFPALIFAYLIYNKRKLKEKLIHNANYDMLTDLPNRLLFNDRVKQTLEISKRYNQRFALMFLDLDDFKKVNDNYGHKAGDTVLKEISKRINDFIRTSDTFARIGGDEFIIILNNIKSKKDISKVATMIIEIVSKPIKVNKSSNVIIGVSIGISVFPEDGDAEDEILKKADNAMYKAKTKGKNNFCFAKNE
jgi:diguanylate cyclase (GGDEF)-like protein